MAFKSSPTTEPPPNVGAVVV